MPFSSITTPRNLAMALPLGTWCLIDGNDQEGVHDIFKLNDFIIVYATPLQKGRFSWVSKAYAAVVNYYMMWPWSLSELLIAYVCVLFC